MNQEAMNPSKIMRDFARMGAMIDVCQMLTAWFAAKHMKMDDVDVILKALVKKYEEFPIAPSTEGVLQEVLDEFRNVVKALAEIPDDNDKSPENQT